MVLSSSRRLSHTAATAPWVSVMIGAPAERHSSAAAAALSNRELSRTKIAAAVCYSGWFGEYPLHPVVDELGPATRHHLRGLHREPLGLEERPGGDAGLGKQPGEPDTPGLGHHGGQQPPPDPAPLVVGRDVHPVDVPDRLQLREP